MHSAKRYLVIALSFALALTVFAAFAPRAVHAITATLVQVVNTASNPVMSRSIDEPARVRYFATGAVNCAITNQDCLFVATAVPAGMRLRVTRIEGEFWGQSGVSNASAALEDSSNPAQPYLIVSALVGSLDVWSETITFDHETDVYFEAGQTPQVEIGADAPMNLIRPNRVSIVGYLVPVAP